MRYLIGFMCVLALAVMGCSETSGTGGSGGDGGVGGAGGGGAGGGGAVTDCTGVEPGTPCGNGLWTCSLGGACGGVPCTEQGIRDAISVGGGPYTLDCDPNTWETVVTEEEIVIDKDFSLEGENLRLDGNEEHRVFSVLEGVTAELRGFTVTRAQVEGNGAGIWNRGTLLLERSTVSENVASGGCFLGDAGGGGGILNQGTLRLEGVTVSGNSADCLAGGIRNDAYATLTIHTSTISGNTAPASGAGIDNDADGVVDIRWSTISGNTHETVAGIGNQSQGSFTIASSVVDDACAGEGFTTLASNGYNIESPGNTCGFDEAKDDKFDVPADDLKLGPLQDNNGATETHALLPGSIAIDVIPEEACEPDEDQRGVARPEWDGTMCDVGAFERWSGDDG